MRVFYLILFTFLTICGCSVKEDRTDCPCRLILDFSDVDTSKVKSLNILVSEGGRCLFNDVVTMESFADAYERDVPHGSLRVNVWAGSEGRIEQQVGVVIPYGCECPPLYMSTFVADTSGESCYEEVRLYKNHCRLTVIVEGVQDLPYSLTFKGNVDGYLLDGNPSSGDFACVAYPTGLGESQAIIPRQTDSSLLLEVDDGTRVAKSFAIGEHISKSGYDWNALNLEDVTLILDYYITYIKVSVQGWDKEYIYNVIL